MDDQHNPYASPTSPVEAAAAVPVDATHAERMRREYLKHEASVQSIGTLYYLGAVVLGFWTVVALTRMADLDPGELAAAAISGVLAVLLYCLSRGLEKLQPWVKGPVAVLSVIGLFAFPLGTLINGYILYLVFCEKGRVVFSPQYREIIRQTPHIKYQSSVVVTIFLVLVVILLAVVGLGFLLD